MNEYDFSRLNDKEFEVFCADVLSAENGVHFERFKPGRDGGIDGFFQTTQGEQWVLQCKHWVTSGLPKVVKYLRDVEAPKVAKIKPSKYFLAVSHSLAKADKDSIVAAFSGSGVGEVIVRGREDLNDILAKHPAIERRHFKLWISSGSVLASLLNNATVGRSEFALREITQKSRLYVSTRNFTQVLDRLEKMGTAIITGEPGVGKTTLAEQIVLHYCSDGYELVCVVDDIKDAEATFASDKRQIFYFDDFLGRNYLEGLRGHEGSHIVSFMRRVKNDKNKRFVLTSRSTILNQGKIIHDVFDHNNMQRNEYEVALESLTKLDRAKILYNHIWHSSLDEKLIEEIYYEQRYRSIIDHPNYNPRLIAFLTDSQRFENLSVSKYWCHIQDLLNNPAKIWEHPFDSQLDDFGRLLVLLVALHGKSISESDLSEAYYRFLNVSSRAHMQGKRDFYVVIRHLSNSMLTRMMVKDLVLYKLFNPSLADFLLKRYTGDKSSLQSAFCALKDLPSLRTLLDMHGNGLLAEKVVFEILSELFINEERSGFKGAVPEYLSLIALTLLKLDDDSEFVSQCFRKSARKVLGSSAVFAIYNSVRLIGISLSFEYVDPSEAEEFILNAMDVEPDELEFVEVARVVEQLRGLGFINSSEKFIIFARDYLLTAVDEKYEDDDIFWAGDDMAAAKRELAALLSGCLKEWGVKAFSEDIVDSVLSEYNLELRMERYLTYVEEAESERVRAPSRMRVSESDGIDELFRRDIF